MSSEFLAGLFEGEGWITCHQDRYVRIGITMTDRDVLENVAAHFSGKVCGPYSRGPHKPQYQIQVAGPRALSLLLELYPQLGLRRRAKIEAVLGQWEHA